jgi:hypothetical protein
MEVIRKSTHNIVNLNPGKKSMNKIINKFKPILYNNGKRKLL